MDPLRFEYKLLNDRGVPTSFFSSRAKVADDHLTLGKDALPLAAISQVIRFMQARLALLVTSDDGPRWMNLIVTSGDAGKVKQRIDCLGSARRAEMRQRELEQAGKGQLFRAAECPYCQATLDLSGFPRSPEMY